MVEHYHLAPQSLYYLSSRKKNYVQVIARFTHAHCTWHTRSTLTGYAVRAWFQLFVPLCPFRFVIYMCSFSDANCIIYIKFPHITTKWNFKTTHESQYYEGRLSTSCQTFNTFDASEVWRDHHGVTMGHHVNQFNDTPRIEKAKLKAGTIIKNICVSLTLS